MVRGKIILFYSSFSIKIFKNIQIFYFIIEIYNAKELINIYKEKCKITIQINMYTYAYYTQNIVFIIEHF